MKTPPRSSRFMATLVVAAGSFPAMPPCAHGGEIFGKVFRGMARVVDGHHARGPVTDADCCVEQLASEIDWLEKYVDRYGSIVAKHPDVWGQSRLTRHRAEYEDKLKEELDKFRDLSNASLRRSDQSFLGLALAIQSMTTGGEMPTERATASVMNMISTGSDPENAVPLERSKPFAKTPGGDFAEFNDDQGKGIGLEPTIHLDHLDRYLKHLQELRRINEGDDIADSPGYALNLVRVPVSILPGQYTQAGHGAEITVTADLQLGDELLPTTFRNLVDNDIVDLLAPQLTFGVNDGKLRQVLESNAATSASCQECSGSQPNRSTLRGEEGAPRASSLRTDLSMAVQKAARTTVRISIPTSKSRRARLPIPGEQVLDVVGLHQVETLFKATFDALGANPAHQPCIHYMDVRGFLIDELHGAQDFLAQPSMAGIWSELPSWNLPELIRTRRLHELEERRRQFFGTIGATGSSIDRSADGEVVTTPGVPAVRGQPLQELVLDPFPFRTTQPSNTADCDNCPEPQPLCKTTTGILAWMILVESALLNERLVEDMQSVASHQGRVTAPGGAWSGPYYGPNPSPEARRSFNDYVRLRWPIRVFALDPVTQEQNIEDMFSKQRELQIALAVAAGGGRLNSQAAMRYARRLETDMATIALNKTAVAFSHGSDTFGWRFYPRFQSPPTRNNLAAFADTLIGSNSQKRDLADRRLEPGIRECTAIVVMPSFVPYVNFDIRTNWFSLNHPQNTDQNMRQTLELSRSIKAMQNSAAQCSQCAGLYRDGEVARLMRRVEQLDHELPLQSMLTQIPYENTSGGFELFNTGITDLAPELIGWYGAAGIDQERPTTVYIVGKGFSVQGTSIIAAGQNVPVELISRQVLRATFPKGLRVTLREAPEAATAASSREDRLSSTAPRTGRQGTRTIASNRRFIRSGNAIRLVGEAQPLPAPAPNPVAPEGDSAEESAPTSGRGQPEAQVPTIKVPLSDPEEGTDGPSKTAKTPTITGEFPLSGTPAVAIDCNRQSVIEVHLATPYGVSNHLLIPVVPKPMPAPAPCPPDGLSFGGPTEIDMFFRITGTPDSPSRLDDFFFIEPDTITIEAPASFIPPVKADLNLTLKDVGDPDDPKTVATLTIPAPTYNAREQRYELDGSALRNLVGDTSRPATDRTLRGGLKPYLDFLLASGGPAMFPPGAPKVFEVSGVLSTPGYAIPINKSVGIELNLVVPK